ncbi:MAG: hypothetical protein JOZ57_15060 [Abitibacteriaceae bacterium]|nr:hypothetical protein [Abditibacteriaceae bacterium]
MFILFLGCLVLGFSLTIGLIYLAVLTLIYTFNWLGKQAIQRRDTKAQDIAQHSVTVEVD